MLLVTLLVLGAVAPGWAQVLVGATLPVAAEADMPSVHGVVDAVPRAGHDQDHDHDPSMPDHVHEAVVPEMRHAPGLRIARAPTWRLPETQPSPGEGTGPRRPPRAPFIA